MIKRITAGVSGLLVLGLIVFSLTNIQIQEDEYMLVKQFGAVVAIHDEAGLEFKFPFIQSTQSIPKSAQFYDLAASDVITKDKKNMVADCFVVWEVEDPLLYLSTLNANTINAESRINVLVYNSLKNIISSMEQSDIISGKKIGATGKTELTMKIEENIGDALSEYGINVRRVETKQLDLPNDNKEAVYERMISERGNIAAAYKAEGDSEAKIIKNKTDAEIAVLLSEAQAIAESLIAEGEAEYMRILSNAYDNESKIDFYEFVISLDAAKASLVNGNNILILDKNSSIAQIFNQ